MLCMSISSQLTLSLTLKDRATRSPVRLDEVIVRCKNTVDVILRQNHPHVVTRKLGRQHFRCALEAVVGKLAMTCRKPAVSEETRRDGVNKAKDRNMYTRFKVTRGREREWRELRGREKG